MEGKQFADIFNINVSIMLKGKTKTECHINIILAGLFVKFISF